MGQASAALRQWIRTKHSYPKKPNHWKLREKTKGIDLSGESATASDWDILELKCEETNPTPKKNAGALAFLDSLLAMPEAPENERAEAMRQRIDRYRLSDRKFFTS